MTDFLPDSEKKQQIRDALSMLGRLQNFAEARMLDQDEVDDCITLAHQFYSHMMKYFPKICTIPKFHHLTVHLPLFVEKHHFWGLISEQPIESFHAQWNDDIARRSNTKDEFTILSFGAKESAIRNAIFDLGLDIA